VGVLHEVKIDEMPCTGRTPQLLVASDRAATITSVGRIIRHTSIGSTRLGACSAIRDAELRVEPFLIVMLVNKPFAAGAETITES
jgi:hypothetical protein